MDRFDDVTNMTIESERRAGKSSVTLPEMTAKASTLPQHGRAAGILVLDIRNMLDNKGGRIRCIPCDAAQASSSSSYSSSQAMAVPSRSSSVCEICMDEFSPSCPPVCSSSCNHAICCRPCFFMYTKARIQEDLIFPWISCPAPHCPHFVPVADFITGTAYFTKYQICDN
jgi:hypothetical protein